MPLLRLLVAALLVVVASEQTHAQNEETEPASPVEITLYPQGESVPRLKHRLLPERVNQLPGNAAVYYGKVKAEENSFFTSKEVWGNVDRWGDLTLEEIRAEGAELRADNVFLSLERGARCGHCDWQYLPQESQFYGTLLPELQESRGLCRLLKASIRIAVANGDYELALQRIRTSYGLALHVTESDFIVGGLVGVAMEGITNDVVLELIQQPGAPNLYWALTAMPTPLIDMSAAIELEAHGIELSYPELADYRGVPLTRDYGVERIDPELWRVAPSNRTDEGWRRLLIAVVRDLQWAIDGDEEVKEEEIDEAVAKVAETARQFLVGRGESPATVASMPPHQAALLWMNQSMREAVDELAGYYHLPYPEAAARIKAFDKEYETAMAGVPKPLRAADHMVRALKTVKKAQTRADREVAVLRVLEALRLQLAENGGELPNSLRDLSPAPAPNDPVTGKPFDYRVVDGAAVLRSPALPDGKALDYQIKVGERND